MAFYYYQGPPINVLQAHHIPTEIVWGTMVTEPKRFFISENTKHDFLIWQNGLTSCSKTINYRSTHKKLKRRMWNIIEFQPLHLEMQFFTFWKDLSYMEIWISCKKVTFSNLDIFCWVFMRFQTPRKMSREKRVIQGRKLADYFANSIKWISTKFRTIFCCKEITLVALH